MGMDEKQKNIRVTQIESVESFFTETIDQAIEKRRISAPPLARQYLVSLLNEHLHSQNVNFEGTLAEMLLRASQAEKSARRELLKRLGDTSLYISGFFGDSLKRKVVDIDYYANMGGMAYSQLAADYSQEKEALVFEDFSRRFLEYVELLTYISQSAFIQSNQDILRLYERYVRTGSELAKDQLIEKGIIISESNRKISNQ